VEEETTTIDPNCTLPAAELEHHPLPGFIVEDAHADSSIPGFESSTANDTPSSGPGPLDPPVAPMQDTFPRSSHKATIRIGSVGKNKNKSYDYTIVDPIPQVEQSLYSLKNPLTKPKTELNVWELG
jgi:hypothetical protein